MAKRCVLLAIVIALLGCTTSQSGTPAAAAVNPDFKNVQVLPHTLTRQELLAVMRTFTRGLGVRCNHCHVVTATEPKEQLDFVSDAKEEKRAARVMIQMSNQINGTWLARADTSAGETPHVAPPLPAEQRVWCWTCHRGKPQPETPPPPPPPAT